MPNDLRLPAPKKSLLLLLPLLAALCVLSSCGTSETAEPASPPETVEETIAADSEPDDSGANDSDEGFTEESGAMVEEDQESDQIGSEEPAIAGEATPGFAALADIDQALVIGLNTYDCDTQPWVSADI